MHLLNSFSLSSGQKIDKIDINEVFFPLPFNDYIIFQPISKSAKTYDYFQIVLDILLPIFNKVGLRIVQIGLTGEKAFEGCYHLMGQTTINQTAYLIKNAKLLLGVDSYAAHLAGHYNVPLATLYSTNYTENVKPFFGDKSKQILLEPERNGTKPSFSFEENPKIINSIKPEKIVESVCKLLDLNFDFPFETVHFGSLFTHPKTLEMCPDVAVNVAALGVDPIIVRMDFKFDENVLINQLRVSNCVIVTDKPISENILKDFKPKIKQVVYNITKDNEPKFAILLQKLGLNYGLISSLTEEELNLYKLDYLDIAMIHRKDVPQKIEDTVLNGLDIKRLYYRTNKITLGRQKIYNSKAAWEKDIPSHDFVPSFQPVINCPAFWEETDYFCIVKLKN